MSDILGQTYPFTFQSAVVADGNGTAANVGGLATVALSVTGLGTATINPEGIVSDGDTNWTALSCDNMTGGGSGTTITTNGIYQTSVAGLQQFRCRISGYSSGTITVKGRGVVVQGDPRVTMGDTVTVANGGVFLVQAAQSEVWTVQPGNTANTTAWKVDASSAAVPVTDNGGSLTVDGAVSVSGTATVTASGNFNNAGIDVTNSVQKAEQQFSYSHITAAATTAIKSGAGLLHSLTINTKSVAGTATVYDSTTASGTVIAVIDTTLAQDTLLYDVKFLTGLTIATADGGVTHADLTVSYR